jgi:hypothetical protein
MPHYTERMFRLSIGAAFDEKYLDGFIAMGSFVAGYLTRVDTDTVRYKFTDADLREPKPFTKVMSED